MRHRKSGRKLGRNSTHRAAMFRNMATSLIEEERIQTTTAKAKELRGIVERLITMGRNNALSIVDGASSDPERTQLSADRVAAVRQAGKYVRNRTALQKLFGELAERFIDRPGGYTRVVKLGRRLGDNADMAIIELLPAGYVKPAKGSAAAPAAPAEEVVEAAEEVATEDAPVETAAEEAEAEEASVEAAAEEAAAEADEPEAADEADAEEKKTEE
jgi:large subunit ribosomal protein L17